MENCEAMTSSTHSFAYSYRLVKKCFLKICETSKCHNFLIFQPIFIRFSLFCSRIFTLSSEIKLNLVWISSLRILYGQEAVWEVGILESGKNGRVYIYRSAFTRCTIQSQQIKIGLHYDYEYEQPSYNHLGRRVEPCNTCTLFPGLAISTLLMSSIGS